MTLEVRLDTCQKCIASDGGCCTDVYITLHRDEMSKFMEAKIRNQIPEGHSFEQDQNFPYLYEYKSNEEPCMFLGFDRRCSIYEERPTICRTYPAMWHKRFYKMRWFIDTTCPLTEEVTHDDIHVWIDLLPNPHLIETIGELDFNTRDKDYKLLRPKSKIETTPMVEINS